MKASKQQKIDGPLFLGMNTHALSMPAPAANGVDVMIAEEGARVAINYVAHPEAAQSLVQRMVPQKSGVILNISSVHEEIAWSGYIAFTASKATIAMLTKTLAQEAAPHGVRVLAVAPSAIKTPINRPVRSDPPIVRRAAAYLLRYGPVSPQDRWENADDGLHS